MSCINAIVLGSGSIGERHARNLLSAFSANVFVVSRSPDTPFRTPLLNDSSSVQKTNTTNLPDLDWDVCVIATPSSIRSSLLEELPLSDIKSLYAEVPLAISLTEWTKLRELCTLHNIYLHGGYNLRYHPGYKYLKDLKNTQLLSFRAIFGEYLPSNHKWEDHRNRYEAVKSLGGGPLLTSHHELDAALNLLGPVKSLSCFEANTNLVIDAADHTLILLQHESRAISTIDLNFFTPKYTRHSLITTNTSVISFEPFSSGLQHDELTLS